MRRWIVALPLLCMALAALMWAPARGVKSDFHFVAAAQAAGERTAQMSKRRDQKQPDEDDSEDENDENDDSDDNADDNE
ncbi:MAG TPA: hypothetical protein VGQ97_00765 [Xanthobacteraceae bacterium]|nr:hypothetical protein [Xanthobacteraceae bacterium]